MTASISPQTFNWTVSTTGMGTGPMHKQSDPKPPTDLLVTRTQQVREGFVGQILVAGRVVFQTEPMAEAEDAVVAANEHLLDKIAALFTG